MSYKIAIASSDEKQIDETFGSAQGFIIYEVTDGEYQRLEKRIYQPEDDAGIEHKFDSCNTSGDCGSGAGCGGGAGGCGGAGEGSAKVELISDCRCIVCKKIGFRIQKQLERKAISVFDVDCSVEEALSKISNYFSHIDNHESLRVQR